MADSVTELASVRNSGRIVPGSSGTASRLGRVSGLGWLIIDLGVHWALHWIVKIWHSVPYWPAATIAAFISAGAAIGVARSATRERQRVLAQENVVELAHKCLAWSNQAAALLGAVRRYLLGQGSGADIIQEEAVAFMDECRAVSRQFTAGRLACNDFEMRLCIAYAERTLTLFSLLVPPSGANETPAEQQQRLTRMVNEGLPLLREFGERTDALLKRGFAAYSARRGLRYRWKEWRFNRSEEAQQLPALPTPLPPIDPGLPPEDGSDHPRENEAP